ncbi:MAG: hypothetical protein WCK51_08485 [Armatimonadota bacterium]
MKPKDWMGVVVRGLGLWFILQGITGFFSLVFLVIRPTVADQGWTSKDYVFAIIMNVLVGLIAIGSAEAVCGLLYPDRRVETTTEPPL